MSALVLEPSRSKRSVYTAKSEDTIHVNYEDENATRWQKFKHSFKEADPNSFPPPKPISQRHLRLISLATGLGTGLLVASGEKLRVAGPLFLLVSYAIVGIFMLQPTIFSAGELSVAYPYLPGGFQSYYRKFIDDSAAFALGWSYMIQWLSVISVELVTSTITIKYWNTSINSDAFVAIFLSVVILINLAGAKGYAEAEFAMNSTKLVMLTGFVLFGLIVDVGGTKHGFIGGRYWRDPGAFTNFKGLCACFSAVSFSFGGSEFISLSVADQANPRKAMKSACKLMMFRIVFFFMGSLLFVGLLVPHTSPKLLGASSTLSNASPFVIAAETYTNGLAHIINSVILISVTSVATSAMYSSPRLLLSLSQQGLAPKYFDYVDRAGRPTRAWVMTIFASFFAFIATYKKQGDVFNWLLSVSAISFIFVWPAICICHIRFRKALKLNGIELSELGYVSPTGIIGSVSSIIINGLLIIAQFYVSLFPVGSGKPSAVSFFQGFLGGVVIFVFYVGHKIWTRNWRFLVPLEEIDINADRVLFDKEILELEKNEEKEAFKQANIFKKIRLILF